MTVGQLDTVVERQQSRLHTSLGDITVDEGGAVVRVKDQATEATTEYEFDEVVERAFSKFLDVNPTYMGKCPSDLKAYNFNYWLRRKPEVQAMLMVGPNGIETMYDPDTTIVTVPEIAGVIGRVFSPEDEIVTLLSDPDKFHVDIQVANSITVPGNGMGDRPTTDGVLRLPGRVDEEGNPVDEQHNVFDITHGGVRILAHPSKPHAPTVERYFNRLICTNGLTMPIADRKITLRGNSVDEVLAEIESAANDLMGSMDDALAHYAELANLAVPGNPLQYIRQVGKEMGIPDRVISKALDYAGLHGIGNPDLPRATTYDVLNIFTALANNDSIRYSTGRKLQAIGGMFVHHGHDMVDHRCSQCERPLLAN